MKLPNPKVKAPKGERLLHVKIPAGDHEYIRQIALRQKVTNAEVVSWAVEALRRYFSQA